MSQSEWSIRLDNRDVAASPRHRTGMGFEEITSDFHVCQGWRPYPRRAYTTKSVSEQAVEPGEPGAMQRPGVPAHDFPFWSLQQHPFDPDVKVEWKLGPGACWDV